jgi:ribosome-associated heat shock protein Hsp15
MTPPGSSAEEGIRLDKWLWAARFFKTRQLATDAINGGKIHLDGRRTKPGRAVRPGTRLTIHKGSLSWEIRVTGISKQRRPADEAAALYEEDEASRLRRQELVRNRRAEGAVAPPRGGKPSKRDRRMIHRFTRRAED